ncbi:cytochrome c oxidase assembly protein, partial [Noviherbaspirillum galbum]
ARHWEGWLVCSLVLAGAVYALGMLRLAGRAGRLGKALGFAAPPAFALGLATLAAALASPLDGLAGESLSAHMAQHMLLMLAAPALIAWGRPGLASIWALPPAGRQAAGRWWRRGLAGRCLRALMRPLPAWLLASAALWFWHVPAAYRYALAHEGAHFAEHLSFFWTSLAFWMLVLHPRQSGGRGHGVALLMLAGFALHSGLLGAMLTFSSVPWYAPQMSGRFGMSALEDQQLAGLLMWIPMNLAHLASFAWLFAGWLDAMETRRPPLARALAPLQAGGPGGRP